MLYPFKNRFLNPNNTKMKSYNRGQSVLYYLLFTSIDDYKWIVSIMRLLLISVLYSYVIVEA